MNSHSDSESPTESGLDGGSNALKPLKTAAAEPVCGKNLQLLGSMDAHRAADARLSSTTVLDERAVNRQSSSLGGAYRTCTNN